MSYGVFFFLCWFSDRVGSRNPQGAEDLLKTPMPAYLTWQACRQRGQVMNIVIFTSLLSGTFLNSGLFLSSRIGYILYRKKGDAPKILSRVNKRESRLRL